MTSARGEVVPWVGLLILLILAPIPSGSISPRTQAFLTGGIYLLWAAWIVITRPAPVQPFPSDRCLYVLLLCWGSCAVFAFVQALVPLPPHFIETLSPSLHDLYRRTLPDYAEGHLWRVLSTTPAATIQSGLLIGACGVAFFLVTRLSGTRQRILALALTVVLIGAGEAIYGLAQVGGSLTRPASGTFVNRNHFSGLLAMALCVGAGLLLSRWHGNEQEAGAPESSARLDRWARSSPLAVVLLTILAGVVFSFSRMGLSAPIMTLTLFGMAWLLGPVSRRIRLVGIGIAAVALLLMAGAWPALEVVAERFQALEDSYRIAAWEGTYSLFQSSPIVGIGLGGLVDNLPRFLPNPIQDTFDHSHNEPLEILAEGGVVYAGLFGIGLVAYFGTLIPAWLARRDPLARGLGLGCLAGISSILLHSLVEFPLRMPANALFLSVIMGLGWAVIQPRASNNSPESLESTARRPVLMSAIILAIALSGMGLSAVAGMADMLDQTGDGLMTRATETAGEARQTLLAHAVTLYTRSSQIEPWQPSHPYRLGRAYEISTASLPSLSDAIQDTWASSAESYRQAVYLHPANARIQAALAWAALQSGDLMGGRRAVEAAMKLAPDDPEVRFAVSRWYLMQWESLNDEEQRLVASLVQRGARERPELYVEVTWQFLQNPQVVGRVLPNDLPTRRLLLKKMTENGLFYDRWIEQTAHPGLQVPIPESGRIAIVTYGRLTGRQESPPKAARVGSWTGMVEGWLSGGLTAALNLDLPPGEIVLYVPIRGEAADGVWPTLNATIGGQGIPLPPISGAGWRTAYVLLTTRGGKFPMQAVLTNGAMILENGHFIERRVTLGPVRVLSPTSMP